MSTPSDAQREHFDRLTEDEAGSTALDDSAGILADDTDERPGRAPDVAGDAGEASPTGRTGAEDFPVTEG